MAETKSIKERARRVISFPGRALNTFGARVTGRPEVTDETATRFLTAEEMEGFRPGSSQLFARRKPKSKPDK